MEEGFQCQGELLAAVSDKPGQFATPPCWMRGTSSLQRRPNGLIACHAEHHARRNSLSSLGADLPEAARRGQISPFCARFFAAPRRPQAAQSGGYMRGVPGWCGGDILLWLCCGAGQRPDAGGPLGRAT